MEHLCYQCGATVEDGVPYCPKCNAPQIRVAIAGGGTETAVVREAESAIPTRDGSAPAAIDWRHGLAAAAQAGLIAAILMAIPLGASFGLGMLAAGFLAVVFYRRRVPGANLNPGKGARLGAASGMLGFAAFSIFTAVETTFMHSGGELRSALMQAVEQAAARNSDPQAQQLLQYLKTPQGLMVVMALGLIVMMVAFLLFSAAGGALGAALLRRKDHP